MKLFCIYLGAGALLAYGTLSAAAQSPAARWNLGEQDPAAADGSPGNDTTKDAAGNNDLSVLGAPQYSGHTPGGGSVLSMEFDGASCYQGSTAGNGVPLDALYLQLNLDHCSLSCDVYPTALGAAGFSFPVSIGANTGGMAPVEVGGNWHLLHKSVANSAAGPAVVLNAWTHLDLVRRLFGTEVLSVLYINGVAAVTNSTSPAAVTDFLTIGANELGSAIPGDVEGYFQGLVDNVVITNLDSGVPPSLTTPLSIQPSGLLPSGDSGLLTVKAQGASPLAFLWRKEGVVIGGTNASSGTPAILPLNNLAADQAGNYDVVVTNQFGSVTSAVVKLTLLTPGEPNPLPMAVFRLGEDDPGSVAGGAGRATTQSTNGSLALAATGTPTYEAHATTGDGTLAMSFDGASFYEGADDAWTQFYSSFDFDHFSVACDVRLTAFGEAGFSFPFSIGGQGAGLAVVEIGGKWCLIHHGVQASSGVDATLDAWTHLELRRMDFGAGVESRLYLDGAYTGLALANKLNPPGGAFIIGANRAASEPEGLFNGQIDNLRLISYTLPTAAFGALTIRMNEGKVLVSMPGAPGAHYVLWRSPAIEPASWTTVADGAADTDGTVSLTDSSPPVAGAFYRLSTP
jgi:hypothetical protein